MWTTYDPPPPDLVPTMIAVVAAADLDAEWELLVLVRDSADEPAALVRGLGTSRILYFTAAEGWSLDAKVKKEEQLASLPGCANGIKDWFPAMLVDQVFKAVTHLPKEMQEVVRMARTAPKKAVRAGEPLINQVDLKRGY